MIGRWQHIVGLCIWALPYRRPSLYVYIYFPSLATRGEAYAKQAFSVVLFVEWIQLCGSLSIVSTRYCTSPSLRHDDVRWASWEKGKKNKKKQLARLLRYIGHWDQVKIKMNIKKDYYTHRNGREWGPFFGGIYLFFFDAMGVYTVTVFHPQNA